MTSHSLISFCAFLCIAGLLAGCGNDMSQTLPPDNVPAVAPINYYRMAPTAPPKPQDETVPDPDDVRTQLWRPGYWNYNGATFSWVPGEMMARPNPTAVWSPDHWIEHTYGWAFIPGYWQ